MLYRLVCEMAEPDLSAAPARARDERWRRRHAHVRDGAVQGGLLVSSWTLVTTGIADHLLLTRLMRRQGDADALPAAPEREADSR